MLLDVTIQPVMFVLLFAFVFGGSITVPGVAYREFLLPGIMAQTMVFSSFVVAMGLTNDLAEGHRRPLPVAADLARVGPGRPEHLEPDPLVDRHRGDGADRPGDRVGDPQRRRQRHASRYLLLLLFGFSMIWLGIWVGSMHAIGRGRPGVHVHDHVPADVRRQHVRADRRHAAVAAHHRGVEPCLGADREPAASSGATTAI